VSPTSFTTAPSAIRFPARCIACGATPTCAIPLQAWRGLDLLYVRWGRTCEIDAPACERCRRRRAGRRALWLTSMIATLLALLGGGVGLAVAVGERAQPFVIAPLVMLGVAYLFFARSRERELFQRWFSPVWLRRYRPKENLVEIGFRDPALQADVQVLSGQKPAASPAPLDYRAPAGGAPPEAWKGAPRRGLPWWLVAGTGVAMIVVGVVELLQYAEYERTGKSFHDEQILIWVYQLAGKWAVFGLFAVVGAAVTAFGVAMKLERRGAIDTLFGLLARAAERRRR